MESDRPYQLMRGGRIGGPWEWIKGPTEPQRCLEPKGEVVIALNAAYAEGAGEGPVSHEHEHSVYTRCSECQSWGINLPGETRCGNCSAEGGVLYVPGCCVRASYAEGRKSMEKEFKELLDLANQAGNFNQDMMQWKIKFEDWKKAQGIENRIRGGQDGE